MLKAHGRWSQPPEASSRSFSPDRYPLTKDVERIEAALGERMALFVRIEDDDGLRRNQILGLQVKDFDAENGFLHSDKGVTIKRRGREAGPHHREPRQFQGSGPHSLH